MIDQKLFDEVLQLPDPGYNKIYQNLIGLDNIKSDLIKESRILLNPSLLIEWSKKMHNKHISLIDIFDNRNAFFIFAGDVGTGKTTLAETFGDNLARENKLVITLYRLSLNTRGSGAVGEMTRLISSAFSEIKSYAKQIKPENGKYKSACILLIDEADALAQSRELDQMHHEDKAGVTALIRGIDSITREKLPIIIVMCTNRLGSIDPAVQRRAASIFEFIRPDENQRYLIFKTYLDGIGLQDEEIKAIAKMTGPNEDRKYGYTYSDIIQKLLPSLVLKAFPDEKITSNNIIKLVNEIKPTPPFVERRNHDK